MIIFLKALEDLSLQYDNTVRNSENTVVQFIYGDDNLNPELMENNDRPVDFDRLRLSISQIHQGRGEKAVMGQDLLDLVEEVLNSVGFQKLLPTGKVFLRRFDLISRV